jgi:undecaprenyl diphosphate synthase
MNQSTWRQAGLHVAVIMDGNGRWATKRGSLRLAGHRAGVDAVRRTVEAAPDQAISVLTLYAFSEDNWQRPRREVDGLMQLFRHFLHRETANCLESGVRLNVIGRRDRIDSTLRMAIERAELATSGGTRLLLRLAVDYSARSAIQAAAVDATPGISREGFSRQLSIASHSVAGVGDVDLLIRTGAERRLSDFLLWEAAYAELYFTDIMWPDFGAADLGLAIEHFHTRERRFGRVGLSAAG